MSAESCCVTCGIVCHATLRCSAVLRRTARSGCRSISPQREKSGSGSVASPAPAAAGAARRAGDQPLRMRLHVVERDAAARPGAGTWLMSTPSSRAMPRTDGAAGAAGASDGRGSAGAPRRRG